MIRLLQYEIGRGAVSEDQRPKIEHFMTLCRQNRRGEISSFKPDPHLPANITTQVKRLQRIFSNANYTPTSRPGVRSPSPPRRSKGGISGKGKGKGKANKSSSPRRNTSRNVVRERPPWLRKEIQGMIEGKKRIVNEIRQHMEILQHAKRTGDLSQVRNSIEKINRLKKSVDLTNHQLNKLYSNYRVVHFRGSKRGR